MGRVGFRREHGPGGATAAVRGPGTGPEAALRLASPLRHTPTRGRPTKDYAEQVGQSILAAAEVLFTRDGFDAVTMDAVAVATQISKGTLYARYANKSDLYLAVMERQLADLGRGVPTVEPDDFPSFDAWFEAFAGTLMQALGHPGLVQFERTLGADARRFPTLVARFHQAAFRTSGRANAEAIERAADHFGLTIPAADFLAEALRSLLWGWARLAPGGDPPPPLAEVASRAGRLLLGGLSRLDPSPPGGA